MSDFCSCLFDIHVIVHQFLFILRYEHAIRWYNVIIANFHVFSNLRGSSRTKKQQLSSSTEA